MTQEKIYIAGQMTGIPHFNFQRFMDTEDFLVRCGFTVVNPARMDIEAGFDARDMPDDSDWYEFPEGLDFREIVKRDLDALMSCDSIYVIDNAHVDASKGCRAERAVAEWLGMNEYRGTYADGSGFSRSVHRTPAPRSKTERPIATTVPTAEHQPVVPQKDTNICCKTTVSPGRTVDRSDHTPSANSECPENPKDFIGSKKAAMSCVPSGPLWEMALVMMGGAKKYGRHNFRDAGVRYSVYYDAVRRHLDRWWEGEDLDEDSGLPHVAHVMACMVVLRDSQMAGNAVDDRPKSVYDPDWMVKMNAAAKEIVDGH